MAVDENVGEVRVTSETGGEKGQKLARFDLIDSRFLWELAKVCGIGARKYSDDNWRKGYEWGLSYGALQRHLHQFLQGESLDAECGTHHMAHVAWHGMVLFVFSTRDSYNRFDTRPERPFSTIFGGTPKDSEGNDVIVDTAAQAEWREICRRYVALARTHPIPPLPQEYL